MATPLHRDQKCGANQLPDCQTECNHLGMQPSGVGGIAAGWVACQQSPSRLTPSYSWLCICVGRLQDWMCVDWHSTAGGMSRIQHVLHEDPSRLSKRHLTSMFACQYRDTLVSFLVTACSSRMVDGKGGEVSTALLAAQTQCCRSAV